MKIQDVMTYDVQTCGRKPTGWRGDADVERRFRCVAGRRRWRESRRHDNRSRYLHGGRTKHRDPANIRVKEVISGKVYGCSPDTDIHEALKIMQQKQVRRLPIISAEDGRLKGILSMNDVALKAQGGRKAELSAEDVESHDARHLRTSRAAPGKTNGACAASGGRLTRIAAL